MVQRTFLPKHTDRTTWPPALPWILVGSTRTTHTWSFSLPCFSYKQKARTTNRPYLLRTSGINRETSTHFPAPQRKKCRRKQTARGCPIAAGISPFPAGGQRLQQRRPAVLLQVLCQPRGLHANPAPRGGKGGGTLANSYQAF